MVVPEQNTLAKCCTQVPTLHVSEQAEWFWKVVEMLEFDEFPSVMNLEKISKSFQVNMMLHMTNKKAIAVFVETWGPSGQDNSGAWMVSSVPPDMATWTTYYDVDWTQLCIWWLFVWILLMDFEDQMYHKWRNMQRCYVFGIVCYIHCAWFLWCSFMVLVLMSILGSRLVLFQALTPDLVDITQWLNNMKNHPGSIPSCPGLQDMERATHVTSCLEERPSLSQIAQTLKLPSASIVITVFLITPSKKSGPLTT